MIRTQVYLTTERREELATLAHQTGRSQSDLVREAVDAHRVAGQDSVRRERILSAAGMWAHRNDLPDFNAIRCEWDREQPL